MIDLILPLLPIWGLTLIAVFNAVGRCGIPLPSTALMVTFGALVIDSIAMLLFSIGVAYVAAIIGDLIAYPLGQRLGNWLERRSQTSPRTTQLMTRAKTLTKRWGVWAVVVTRWPLSTLGPYVNLIVGAADLKWRYYVLACLSAELVWVTLYLSLGYGFSANLDHVLERVGNASALILAIALIAGIFLFRRARKKALLRQS